MKACNIQWDTDGDMELFRALPEEVEIPDGLFLDEVGDYLSDLTGFCHFGFEIEI